MGVHKWGSRMFGDFFEFLLVFRLRDLQNQIRREKPCPKIGFSSTSEPWDPRLWPFSVFASAPKHPFTDPHLRLLEKMPSQAFATHLPSTCQAFAKPLPSLCHMTRAQSDPQQRKGLVKGPAKGPQPGTIGGSTGAPREHHGSTTGAPRGLHGPCTGCHRASLRDWAAASAGGQGLPLTSGPARATPAGPAPAATARAFETGPHRASLRDWAAANAGAQGVCRCCCCCCCCCCSCCC